MKITMVINKQNKVKHIFCEDSLKYTEQCEYARKNMERFGWMLYTEETDKGYAELKERWEKTHR